MKKVVSTSLFWLRNGADDHSRLYSAGLRAICRAHHTLMPGWEWRIHCDDSLPGKDTSKLLHAYEAAGLVKLVFCGPVSEVCRGMLWRLLPVWDKDVSHTICRDLDSLPTPRDAVAINQFVASGAALHAMNDNVQHGIPIMGGMCGFRNDLFQKLTHLKSFEALCGGMRLSVHGDDQQVLEKKVWPALQGSLCEHRLKGYKTSPTALKSYTSINPFDLKHVPSFVINGAEALIPFMGTAGFDYPRAEAFYNEHGPAQLIERIKKAEHEV